MAAIPLSDLENAIAYPCPSHAASGQVGPGLCIKRRSFPEGETPPHLERYVGQVSGLAQQCEGRTGSGFRRCMKEAAKNI